MYNIAMIKVSHLGKKYHKKVAVDDISFEIATGKVTGFLGPNGAGKSTTMRLMLGLDSGKGITTYGGKKLHEYAQPSRVVGVLLEAKAFHPTRSARNHLKILADEGGIPTKRVGGVLGLVGLDSVASKGPGKFSLGMAQRLGIAAAVLGEPKYLILDEPANGLDPEGVAWLRKFLGEYADAGNAVFVSSHLLSEVQLMADDIVVIGKGKLIANTSMKALTSGSKQTGVFVRTADQPALKRALQEASINFELLDGGLKISGKKTDDIGELAFGAGVPILELTNRSASLEDVFLELTEGTEEYGPTPKEGSRK